MKRLALPPLPSGDIYGLRYFASQASVRASLRPLRARRIRATASHAAQLPLDRRVAVEQPPPGGLPAFDKVLHDTRGAEELDIDVGG
jgi:hypothetical protein